MRQTSCLVCNRIMDDYAFQFYFTTVDQASLSMTARHKSLFQIWTASSEFGTYRLCKQ